MKPAYLLAIVIVAAFAAALFFLLRPGGAPPERGAASKPAAPFSVVLVQTGEAGDFRTLEVHLSTQVDVSGASLALVPFDGLSVVEPASPVTVDMRKGESRVVRVRVRLSPSGGGALTAELTARFPDGSARVASDVVRYEGGEAVRPDAKIGVPAPGPVRVQDVPAPGSDR